MFVWEIYEIFRAGFTRNTRECRLLQIVVAGKCFDQKIFLKKNLSRFDIQWHYNCLLYVNEGNSFVMFNNMRWELCSHVTCRDINVIYYLKCNMCDHKETCIGKTSGDNVVGFKSRISILVIVEQVFPLVNFPYTYITVTWKINV